MSEARRILVADDSETITTLLKTTLESHGYQVVTANDGVDAYVKGRDGDFDLAIVDQLMPGLLGLEVTEKWHNEGVKTPVIILTGVDDERVVVESFDVGATDFMRKPFRVPELLARVERRLD